MSGVSVLETFIGFGSLFTPIILIIFFVRRRNKFWFNYVALFGEILFFEHIFFKIQHYPGQVGFAIGGILLLLIAFFATLWYLKSKQIPSTVKLGISLTIYGYFILSLSLNLFQQQTKVSNSYQVISGGLKYPKTNKHNEKINPLMDSINALLKNNPSKVKPIYDKANQAKDLSNNLCNHIDSLKTLLISVADGIDWKKADTISLLDVENKENFDIPTRIMINTAAAEDGSKGEAHKLRMMLDNYRKSMLVLLNKEDDSSSINIGLLAKGGYSADQKYQKWELFNFEEQPLASAIVTLTRIQNDVRNAEMAVIRELKNSI